MRHRLVNLATAFSLLLCAGAAAAWVGTRSRFIGIAYGTPERYGVVAAEPSGLSVNAARYDDPRFLNRFTGWSWVHNPSYRSSRWGRHHWLGFYADSGRQDTSRLLAPRSRADFPTSFWSVVVPYWAALIATAAMPLLWARGRLRRRPPGPCFCRGCGYDLRATPDRCPECGVERAGVGTTA